MRSVALPPLSPALLWDQPAFSEEGGALAGRTVFVRNRMALAQQFESLFSDPRSRRLLRRLLGAGRTTLPTFNLTTTSLRHLNKWFDHLEEIRSGAIPAPLHGNYFSDPATIGLVDNAVRPRVLTPAGKAFLSREAAVYNDPPRAEYALVEILYFAGYPHKPDVQQFLKQKRQTMIRTLMQFQQTPVTQLFIKKPQLLVVAELVSNFPGAIPALLRLPAADLNAMAGLGEAGFSNLCNGPGFLPGLSRLCRRIGGDYTRAEDRRLHFIVSHALFTILMSLPQGQTTRLQIPAPYANLLTEADVYALHVQYTSDLTIWFDGIEFQVTATATFAAVPQLAEPTQAVSLQPLTTIPTGIGMAPATAQTRRQPRRTSPTRSHVILDPVASERGEDFVEQQLRPQYGAALERVGHRAGEILSLPDGYVPGADFYVVDGQGNPNEFIEVKLISGPPPVDVTLTRAEYLRAIRCAAANVPYRLFLVDLSHRRIYRDDNFGTLVAALTLAQVPQFVIRVG